VRVVSPARPRMRAAGQLRQEQGHVQAWAWAS
jgi:hypothetical protein